MKLQNIIDNALQIDIRTCGDTELIKQIQQCLGVDIDGIIGGETMSALADFKAKENLEHPTLIGSTTAKQLLEAKEEQGEREDNVPPKLNPDAGSKTGNKMKMPPGIVQYAVYANEFILPGVPLTWGEVTANCTRVPTSEEYVENAIRLAKVWGEVREKFGSPIAITSGYRPPRVNKAVGGVSNSQHLYFRALDMKPFNGDYQKLWRCLEKSKFSGLGDAVFRGRNKGFFHADIRPGGRCVFAY